MGNDLLCRARIGGKSDEGKALLETDTLLFRGKTLRETFRFADMKNVRAEGEALSFDSPAGAVRLEIGPAAAKWADKILNPKSLVEKLGIKPGQKISILGAADDELPAQLEARGISVSSRLSSDADVVFLFLSTEKDLARIATTAKSMGATATLWTIRPKGKEGISETATRNAGLAASLVDVKVVRYSDTHTAEKFVRRKA